MAATSAPLGFEEHIKPLFRESDRSEMEWAFDLWSYEDVVDNAKIIYERLADGTMPCFERWDKARVDVFRQWMDTGFRR